jgi:hypothetical protein
VFRPGDGVDVIVRAFDDARFVAPLDAHGRSDAACRHDALRAL